MNGRSSRRRFLQATATAGVGFWVAGGVGAQQGNSPNERIGFAAVGVGGKGSSDSADAGRSGEMIALCDVDISRLEGAGKRFPKAKKYTDFRKMLEENHKQIDAVTVSTPDHVHAVASVAAMRMGKHCFTQKPLTHSVYEARVMAQVARRMKVATQMGNQGTASSGLRKAAAVMRSGVLGKIRAVHVWSWAPVWPQGSERPAPQPPPPHLDWDLWLGPAPERPYGPGYHPFAWRGWWDFGTGSLGDQGCHQMNQVFMGLDLRNPISVQAETSGHNRDSFPKWSVVTYQFPANEWRSAVKLVWYDGGKKPPQELLEGQPMPKSGSLVIGEKGRLYSPTTYGDQYQLAGVDEPQVEFAPSPGHFNEWVQAIRGGEPARSNFPDYAGPLAETVLVGNLAIWLASEPGEGPQLQWDAENLRAKNAAGLEPLIRHPYRKGYTL
jgi:predicted dehydrogenase